MATAYLILAHKGPAQVARLAARLSSTSDTRVMLHVDAKADIRPFQTALHAAGVQRLSLVSPRVVCHWGGFGHVQATMNGLRAVLREPDLSHVSLLTGQDYPLKPMAYIESFLSSHATTSFISWSVGSDAYQPEQRDGNDRWYWDGDLRRLVRRHFRLRGRIVPVPNPYLPAPRKKIPQPLAPAQGLAYWTLAADAARYCLEQFDTNVRLRRFFRSSLIPDENMFQMLLLASPFRQRLENEDLRFIRWLEWHPAVLTSDDMPRLQATHKLFGRKFDEAVDATVLDELDTAARAAGNR